MHYWGEAGDALEELAKPIIARWPRQQCRMQRVQPGEDPDDPFWDLILESIDLRDSGNYA